MSIEDDEDAGYEVVATTPSDFDRDIFPDAIKMGNGETVLLYAQLLSEKLGALAYTIGPNGMLWYLKEEDMVWHYLPYSTQTKGEVVAIK